jgi:Flp pilus assembly pilin Flp
MPHGEEWFRFGVVACRGRMGAICASVVTMAEALWDTCGQDLVEYAIVASLISLAAIVGMKSVATSLGTAFTHIATTFGTYTS